MTPITQAIDSLTERQCQTCDGQGRLINTTNNRATCPYDDTVPCPDCDGDEA